jgi:hypothetical protein
MPHDRRLRQLRDLVQMLNAGDALTIEFFEQRERPPD